LTSTVNLFLKSDWLIGMLFRDQDVDLVALGESRFFLKPDLIHDPRFDDSYIILNVICSHYGHKTWCEWMSYSRRFPAKLDKLLQQF